MGEKSSLTFNFPFSTVHCQTVCKAKTVWPHNWPQQEMFYTEITETMCKTVRFSGIYGLYVNNGVQKTYFFGFGYWRPWVRILRAERVEFTRKRQAWEYSPPVKIPPSIIFHRTQTRSAVLRRLENIVAMRRSQVLSFSSLFPSGASS
mgnify:CR=1 FL=1